MLLRRLSIPHILSALALTASGGCGGTEPSTLSPCTAAITPSVTGGSRFTWTPRCGLSEIAVVAPPSNGGPQVLWALEAGSTLLAPGIEYGVAPNGASSTTGPSPAQPGIDYHVSFYAPGITQSVGDLTWRP